MGIWMGGVQALSKIFLIGAVFSQVLLFGESPSLITLIGAVLCLTSVAAVVIDKIYKERGSQEYDQKPDERESLNRNGNNNEDCIES